MDIELHDDPSLPDWDGAAELTPWQQLRARISMDWARVVAAADDGPRGMAARERAARLCRLHMTPRERAEDDRARRRVADLNRALAARDTREYLRSQGRMYGLTHADPTRAEILAAWRVRAARRIGMDRPALRRDLYHADHAGFAPDELLDPDAVANGRNPIERACDVLERRLAERPLTYAEILAARPELRPALLAQDGRRVYHVLVVGDAGVRPDAGARMPTVAFANPLYALRYAGTRCGFDEPTLMDRLWPEPEVQVARLRALAAAITHTRDGGSATQPPTRSTARTAVQAIHPLRGR